MPQPTTAGSWLHGICDMLNAAGLDAGRLFSLAGIEADAMRDPQRRFASDQLSHLWNVITRESGDDAIALAASDRPRPAMLDLLTYTMMTAPTLEAALQRFIRYIRVISDATSFTLEPDPGRGAWLRMSVAAGDVTVPRQRCEFILVTVLNIVRWISDRPITPLAIELAYEEPGSTLAHARAFGGPLQFKAAANGLLIRAADLASALPAANSTLSALHERCAIDFLDRMDEANLTSRVRELIIRALPDGDPPRSAAAAALCISERTLQRRLQDEGTSYQDLVDETRRALARGYLAREQMALAQIAFMLGFADQSAFCRAFQRWFKVSPSQYRKLGMHGTESTVGTRPAHSVVSLDESAAMR